MSIFGSLFTAVSAMTAQSQSMGMISNNIANVSTVGYKRIDAAFSSLVTSESRSVLYSPGSVRANQNARIDQQGILQQSNSATDIAISGNGFFVVKSTPDGQDLSAEPFYTRAGSFSESASGVLQNTAGFSLYGWPLDQNGVVLSTPDISSLVPVDVAFLGGLTQATTDASISVNLDAGQTTSVYPVPASFVADFSRDIQVFDSLGDGQVLTASFKRHESPTATAEGTVDLSGFVGPLVGQVAGLAAGDDFTVDVASAVGTPVTIGITATTTLADLLSDLNNIVDTDGNSVVFADINEDGELTIKARNLGEDLTIAENTNTPLTDLGLGGSLGLNAAPAAPNLLATLDEVPNTENWWHVEFATANGAILSGSINFNGSGQLNATATSSTGAVNVDIDSILWPNTGAEPQDIDFDISAFTQFAGEYNVISSNQNGAELGLRTGVSIDSEGFVTAQFSNGQSAKIYKLAIATFANSNGLNELTGNVFRQSDGSGDFNLREAGTGSAGQVQGGALEASNVDLADEFSKMIVTQRAYSANTKVISTADQMTEELLRLR